MDNEGCSFATPLPAWAMKRTPADGSPLAGRFRHFFRHLTSLARHDLQKLPEHPARSIHHLRVRMKKLAAVLRLVKRRMRPQEYEEILGSAKRLKNAFAQQRDAQVAAKLQKKQNPYSTPKVRLPKKAGAPLFIEAAILERLLSDASLKNVSRADVVDAYVKCYGKGRRQMKKCLKKATPELLHQWRGPVKRFFYQSLLLHHAKGAQHRIARSKQLGQWLGKDHDQHLLAEQARAAFQLRIVDTLEAKRISHHRRIFRLAKKLYKIPPRELRRKLEKHL